MLFHRWVEQDDATAAFEFDISVDGRIEKVRYRCTTCMTLVALCEHVAQDLQGASIEEVTDLTADGVLNQHPEIPSVRRSRAQLAVAAAHAAMDKSPS